jgi:tetratricopeptide (TPR) repeat protein
MGWLRDTLLRFGTASTAQRPAAPMSGEATNEWRQRGNTAIGKGDWAEAARCYEQGVALDPQDAALRLNLGFALLESGQFGPAEQRLLQALALRRPEDQFLHEAHYLLARAQAGAERLEAALASAEAACRARPDFAEAIEEGARILVRLERHVQAAEWLQRLVRLQPTPFNRILLANSLAKIERGEEGLELLRQVCMEDPSNAQAHLMRHDVLLKLRRPEESLEAIDRTLALVQRNAQLVVNRSVSLERLGRYEESLQCVEEALAMEPTNVEALANRPTLLLALMRVREAIAAAEEGLRHHPDNGDLHWNLAIGLMLTGDFQRGWKESEWRTRTVAFRGTVLGLRQPQWQGESLAGKTILLHAEQGFGDAIQFLRFVPEVARRAAQAWVLVPEQLEALVGAALPANCRILHQHSQLPPIDVHCPFMSLPAVLGTTLDTLPNRVPYLHAMPADVQRWRERLGGAGPRIGIAWSGNPKHGNDHNRSMALATFRPVDAAGCRFFTVQPQMPERDRPVFAEWDRAEDIGRELRNFQETAALFEALDLVITVDTSVAHLAGALGRPVWILLPYAPDWRWMLDREDSPWYPTARLYRQGADRSWAPVIERVRSDLLALAAAR